MISAAGERLWQRQMVQLANHELDKQPMQSILRHKIIANFDTFTVIESIKYSEIKP